MPFRAELYTAGERDAAKTHKFPIPSRGGEFLPPDGLAGRIGKVRQLPLETTLGPVPPVFWQEARLSIIRDDYF